MPLSGEGRVRYLKRNIKRFTLLAMLLTVLCVLSACGFDSTVEDLFTLPSVPDE